QNHVFKVFAYTKAATLILNKIDMLLNYITGRDFDPEPLFPSFFGFRFSSLQVVEFCRKMGFSLLKAL
ncbi:MAG: hypothetical protein KDA65_19200, partial [Planctomycetaceae bacterium]|nr:hypothetical protein [Planctomycetaceae bacterium]